MLICMKLQTERKKKKSRLLKIKHDVLQIRVQTVAPHTLRGLIHALLLRLARSFHGHATGRAGTSASTTALRAGRSVTPSALIEESLYPKARLLAYDIRIVRGGC